MAEIAQLYGNDAGRRLKREWRVERHMGENMKPVSPVRTHFEASKLVPFNDCPISQCIVKLLSLQ